MTAESLTIAGLERWAESGAHWQVLDISATCAVVELRTCMGEPVERHESADPEVIAYLRAAPTDLDAEDVHARGRYAEEPSGPGRDAG